MSEEIKIGSTVWVFDPNRRIYERNDRGGPIYKEHWRQEKIVSDTSRSWVLEYGRKIPKRGEHFGICLNESELNDACYVNDCRYHISELINRLLDAEKLRKIAAIVGYIQNSK